MRVAPLFGLGMIAAIAVTGCSKREELKVAHFKDRSITVAQFEEAYARVDESFLPKTTGLEGKKEFLTTMLNKEVMAAKADELGYDKDPAVAQGMEAFRRMSLNIAYLKKQVADKITVSEKELREYYDNTGVSLSVKQILCDIESQADAAYAALKGGMDFDTACRTFSKSDDAADGGLVVTVTFGSLMPSLQAPLFRLPVGGFTEPVYTPHGWVIVKVLKGSDPVQKTPYDEVKEELRRKLRSIKEGVALNEFTDKLRKDYGVEWNYDNLAIAFNALPPDREFDAAPTRSDEIYPLLYFDPADYDKPLVTYQGKSTTIKDFSDLYDRASFFTRPRRVYRYGGIRSFLTDPIMNEISVDVVRKSRIEEDPEVAAVLKAKREEIMVGLLYEDMVNKQTVITAAAIQDYYNDNVDRFRTPEKRKFGVILTGDIETALRALGEIRARKPFRTVALAYSIDDETRETMGETPELAFGEQPEIDVVGFKLRQVGDVSEPFQTSRGWMVLKLLERVDARTFTLDEARTGIEGALREIKNDEKLEELLTKWKEEYGVVIDEKNLEKNKYYGAFRRGTGTARAALALGLVLPSMANGLCTMVRAIGGLGPPIAFVALTLAAVGCERRDVGALARDPGPVVARVNGQPLYRIDLDAYLPTEETGAITAEERKTYFDRWVATQLLYEEAARSGMGVSDDIDRKIEQYKKDLVADRLVEEVLKTQAMVTRDEVMAYYRAHKDEFNLEVRVSHILTNTMEDADKALEMLETRPFSWVARKMSVDRHTGAGGDLGYLSKGNMLPEFESVVFKMRVGEVKRCDRVRVRLSHSETDRRSHHRQ